MTASSQRRGAHRRAGRAGRPLDDVDGRPTSVPCPGSGLPCCSSSAVVLWPAIEMLRTSLLGHQHLRRSAAGSRASTTSSKLARQPGAAGILVRTITWVVVVVERDDRHLARASRRLLNAAFPGRRIVRWALIVPWAASVVMTATIWRWMLDGFYGIVNRILVRPRAHREPRQRLAGHAIVAFIWLMAVAIFVSLPFTTYVILAGLQSIPADIYEAARVDGATGLRTYRYITLPLLRPALLVAAIINMINVFNSFPIIWVMTDGGPGFQTDTTTTFMYKLAFRFQDIGQSAAMAVVNFAVILVFVLFYLRVVDWRRA